MSDAYSDRLVGGTRYHENDVPDAADLEAMAEIDRTQTWVCDGCMGTVRRDQVGLWADFEHVLCRDCYATDRRR